MENKQGRRKLPAWYLDKVNLAAAAFAGAPDGVERSRPHIAHKPGGIGINAQRQGRMTSKQPGLGLDLDGLG